MKILKRVLDSAIAHARESRPRECCGILLATEGRGGAVDMLLRAENAEKGNPHRRFALGHRAHIRAVRMESLGTVRIAGYYHSHPQGPARPSAADAAASTSEADHLIIGLPEGEQEATVWRWRGEREGEGEGDGFRPEPLEVIEE